ncbi:family 10 glycosylhydrolase [Flavihumibacter rivuli]|uniref:family 10 glycosylhydrolase n=1 Tax=Flavihumibacter rivuli TaxID=2838156 RepID=UPI001BDE0C32|nr:family 10 glycosylhydrolase [Flavihumibacter rivuli]ULQ55987.1 family 10 glycosylhydrolase [Flavihumibacter rivuli]
MKKHLLLWLVLAICCSSLSAQSPKRELRGAWIASYLGIDWPNRNQTPEAQRAALVAILDHHKATGLNAIYLQVRSQCDALYPSTIDPWSSDLTGTQGKAPNPLWDPLQFAIDECHKRGMELHAWLNPYRAVGNSNNLPGFASNHIAKLHPEWLISTGNLRTLDPGIPGVRDYINSVISDIVTRYDVDGIHFDDYFYPNASFNDDATYAADPRDISDRGDWRRDNVNLMVSRVSATIKQIKPWVEFGISPSGIYRNSTDPAVGSATSGLQHYSQLYADSRKWLQEGWIDYLAPQVYWYIDQPGANYGIVTPWWNNNSYGRLLYIGLAGYKVNDPAQGSFWANPSQIPNQVRLNRSLPNISGQAVYNTSSLRSTTRLGFRDSLRLDLYKKPALHPAMPWIDNTAPAAAASLKVISFGTQYNLLKWKQPIEGSDEMDKVRQYAIYRSTSPEMDINNSELLLAITNTNTTSFEDRSIEPGTTYYYQVTALDRLHNESSPTNAASFQPPTIQCPDNQVIELNASCSAVVPDFLATLAKEEDVTYSQSPAAGSTINGPGATTITLTATDLGGNSISCTFQLTTVDVTAPVISGLRPNITELAVPNHQLRTIKLFYEVTDNCGHAAVKVEVTSNEEQNGLGDGDTDIDWEIISNDEVKLRAERSGTGTGRVYTISVTTTDASGNSSTASTTVTVPLSAGIATAEAHKTVAAPLANNNVPNWIKVLPNPSSTEFTLQLTGNGNQRVDIRMVDNLGRVMEKRNGLSDNTQIRFGAAYRPGIYYLELQRGKEKQVIKLIKQ